MNNKVKDGTDSTAGKKTTTKNRRFHSCELINESEINGPSDGQKAEQQINK